MIKPQRGVTIVELLVVVALVGFITTLAMPSYQSMIANNQARTARDQITMALELARSQAVSQGAYSVLCAANATNNGCLLTATTWDNGWILCTSDIGGPVCTTIVSTGNFPKGAVSSGLYTGTGTGTYAGGSIINQSYFMFNWNGYLINNAHAILTQSMAAQVNLNKGTACQVFVVCAPNGTITEVGSCY